MKCFGKYGVILNSQFLLLANLSGSNYCVVKTEFYNLSIGTKIACNAFIQHQQSWSKSVLVSGEDYFAHISHISDVVHRLFYSCDFLPSHFLHWSTCCSILSTWTSISEIKIQVNEMCLKEYIDLDYFILPHQSVKKLFGVCYKWNRSRKSWSTSLSKALIEL